MSQGADLTRCRDLNIIVYCRNQREVRLRDRVDVTHFGARQAPHSEGPSLRIEACDGNLSSAETFSGFMPEYSLVGQQDVGNSKIMIIDCGIADAGEMDKGTLLGFRTGPLNRRSFLFGSAVIFGALGLAGCATSDGMSLTEAAMLYGPVPDKKFPIPAVDVSKIDPKYYRRTVRYDTREVPGTIIVDPGNYYVYRIEGDGNATRYGANVGRDGFLWSGEAYVGRKAEWPTWTPPKEMILRQPEARKYAGGMPGGLDNPLGARTLYLYQKGVYTLYTIYSTSDPESIGTGVTSGCTGLLTQDMIDLYSRTPVKTKVIVLPA
jgi:lipoprotein-anchoring transpeptidase ErfK/SrfK